MRLIKRPMTRRISIRSRELYRLRLASGGQLEVPSAHRMRKVDGWAPMAELLVCSRVAALRRLSEPAQPKRMHESEVIMLAHMIGDGTCIKRQPVRYASI